MENSFEVILKWLGLDYDYDRVEDVLICNIPIGLKRNILERIFNNQVLYNGFERKLDLIKIKYQDYLDGELVCYVLEIREIGEDLELQFYPKSVLKQAGNGVVEVLYE